MFQQKIHGPVVSVTTSTDATRALAIANDRTDGLSAGVWPRDGPCTHRFGSARWARRVWVTNWHAYAAHAACGGYRQLDIGRETHGLMMDRGQQTKTLLVRYHPNKRGFP